MAVESKAAPKLDAEESARYHRPRKPVEVRRRASWKRGLWLAVRVLAVVLAVGSVAVAGFGGYQLATASPVFRLKALDSIEVLDAVHASPEAVRERFEGDIGRTLFSIPLEERRKSIEEIPWVESATVQRVLPHTVRVYMRERTPVAFVRQGASLCLVDRYGVLLPTPEGAGYSFPVLTGVPENLTTEERRDRVALYLELTGELDANGQSNSAQLSEIDLSDPENLSASVSEADGVVWLYFGRGRYQEKFETFLRYRPEWKDSPEPVHSVDLRYRGQIVLNPALPAGKGRP
ncbi:MAG: FtsQ-type POTRA domain-containing protein [Acidobacteria bacterium]|nr:FtsQ-type POTRA domain-containing protein [Acidobacteriota bacterium]